MVLAPKSDPFFAGCAADMTVPFQLEFDALASLFGVERMYLRNHVLDATFMRDWSMNRMLARFGLPHWRTRKLRFFINGDYIGFYDAVEAVDQEYVFARNFAEYNPFNYSLYKRKVESIGCGLYDPDTLADAATRLDDPSKPPYNFESGTHRDPIPVHGRAGLPLCMNAFAEKFLIGDVRGFAVFFFLWLGGTIFLFVSPVAHKFFFHLVSSSSIAGTRRCHAISQVQ
jgi:CotH kinase protein